jgi:hypothetical protein
MPITRKRWIKGQPRQRRVRLAPSHITIIGDVARVEVSLSGAYTIIDASDYDLVAGIKWCISKGGVRNTLGQALHRAILSCPTSLRVDHINGDTLDNRRSNLRIVDAAQNGWNRTRKNANNTSGFPGVSRNRNNWAAYINIRGKRVILGTFPTKESAAAARRSAELQYFGEYAPRFQVSTHKSPALGVLGGDAPIVNRT